MKTLLLPTMLCLCTLCGAAETAHIGAEDRVAEHPRSRYCRYVNWRPADGETVRLNPPRISWPYRTDWPENWGNDYHTFRLQIAARADMQSPVVDAPSIHNFYNALPILEGYNTWYWRVGYDVGTPKETWSPVRSFTIAPDAVTWDRRVLEGTQLEAKGHPRILMNPGNLAALRDLATTHPSSRAALATMRKKADATLRADWWNKLPDTDRGAFPKRDFYMIAHDLVNVCFVWKMTDDPRYSSVKDNAVKWASYKPGGRASPEGLGGDGSEDATQGNEFLALLFDWLYNDLNDDERRIMIESLEWRTRHIMHRFSWSLAQRGGPMLRLTFRADSDTRRMETFEAENGKTVGGEVKSDPRASGGKVIVLAQEDAEITRTLTLQKGSYVVTVHGCGPTPNQDAFHVSFDDQKGKRVYIQGWGRASASLEIAEMGPHVLRIRADPREIGMQIDKVEITPQSDKRLGLEPSGAWETFDWEVGVPSWATSAHVEAFNYYAGGTVLWSKLQALAQGENQLEPIQEALDKSIFGQNGRGDATAPSVMRQQAMDRSRVSRRSLPTKADPRDHFPDGLQVENGTLMPVGGKPEGWKFHAYGTDAKPVFLAKGGPGGGPAAGTECPDESDRGSWGRPMPVKGGTTLRITGSYLARTRVPESVKVAGGMAGCIGSHPYESAMDTAVCGVALYEHSPFGRKWFDISANYLAGISCGHGFDEAWNEGAGYGTSKCKWLVNAALYYDTALDAKLGKNPFFTRIGEWFRRVIPVGMNHHAWGNQANASRGNHLAHFRKLAHLTGDGRFLYNWQAYGGKEFSTFRPWIEYVLPHFYAEPEPVPETDYADVFPIAGWAMAASGAPSDPATYKKGAGVILQCRTRGAYGHSFYSDSSVQFHAFGEMLNHGGGSSANQDAYAYHTMSHNTLLIDGLGQAQPSGGMAYPTYGRIVGYREAKDFVYMAADPTRCYPAKPGNYSRWGIRMGDVYTQRAVPHLQHFVRHVLFIKKRYFVLYDDVACSKPSTYTWLYHIKPKDPFSFDPDTFTVRYGVGDVSVILKHLSRPNLLHLEDRKGLDAYRNPVTGEDYRKTCKAKRPCAHNLWVSNAAKVKNWSFLAVVYPSKAGETVPEILRVDDTTVRVGTDIICFDPNSPHAKDATLLVDANIFRPQHN